MIIITIIKITGVIILSLLALALLLLALIMFAPVSYRINGRRDEGTEAPIHAELRLHWLFGLLRGRFAYPGAPYFVAKALFFTIYDSRSEDSTKVKKTAEGEMEEEEAHRDDGADQAQGVPAGAQSEQTAEAPGGAAGRGFRSFMAKFIAFFTNIGYTMRRIYAKIRDRLAEAGRLAERVGAYVEVLRSGEFGQALRLCTGELGRIWRNIRPRRIRARLKVGTGDPASTAQILQLHSILYPFIGSGVLINPDFERAVFYGDFDIRGRITIAVVLWAAWVVYRDENIRKVMAMFKDI